MEKVLNEEMYKESVMGVSLFSDSKVEIIGEQTVKLEDGRMVERYLYNIVGHTPENGQPFVSLKGNIVLL